VSGDFRKARETIKVLMLDSPAYRAIRDLTPDFEKKFGIKAEYTAMDYSKLSALMESVESRSKFDVFLVDIPWIPDLVQSGALLELSEFSSEVEEISKSFIPGVLSAYSEFDGGIYALPFMFGTQLLYYRKDLFEDGSLKLKYNEKYGYELKVPKTWAEFNQAAEFFTKSFNPESPVKFGTTLGGRETSGAVCEFLPRLWAYDGFFFSREGRVNPDRTAFIKALKVYKESYKYTDPGSPDFWWDEQLNEFRAGDAAMMIMFIAHASGLADTAGTKIAGKIGYDIIPGGCPLLGGWSIGINSSSSRPEESFSFISWAASKELAIPQTILGGSTASISLYKSSELLTIYPWLPKALESFKTSRKRDISRSTTMGRLSEKDFEQILGNAIHNVIKGETEPEEAADEVFHEILEGLSNTGG
jgi:ABC-type glycerol-3-phosphate transport system substrate-binding protein